MAEPGGAHLSIGEVLGLLLEEFPDVTISKIRFLESQGLIEPERTPSGYRKFYDDDVELLRVILREQREKFLPLRVIKDRIDSGADRDAATRRRRAAADEQPTAAQVAKHPAAGAAPATPAADADRRRRAAGAAAPAPPTPPPRPAPEPRAGRRREPAARLLPGVLVNRDELCAMASVTPDQLAAARGVRRACPSAAAPATCTATRRSRSPRPPAGSCAPASTPATCGPGGRRSSARPGCTSS